MSPARLAPLPPLFAEIRKDRHATCEALHRIADVFQSPGERSFLVIAHGLVAGGLRSRDFLSNKRARFFAELERRRRLSRITRRRLEDLYAGWLMCMDPPDHPLYRSETLSALPLRPAVAPAATRAIVESALGGDGPACEAVSALMMPYLRLTMASVIGCSVTTYRRLVQCSKPILELFLGRTEAAELDLDEVLDAYDTLESLLRRRHPGGLIAGLCDRLSADDPRRAPLLASLVADTWEPVLALMATGVLHGLAPRSGRRLLRSRLDRSAFFHEMARLETPFQICDRRVGPAGASLGGLRFEPEDTVVFAIGMANRDPRAFERPGEIDLHRRGEARPLSFGAGAHACLGARLAFEICTRFWGELSVHLARRPHAIESFRWRDVIGTRILDSLKLGRA